MTILETDNEVVERKRSAKTNFTEEKNKKQTRAHGGCLGFRRRGRTRQAAKSSGELQAGYDPEVSEWGNPSA